TDQDGWARVNCRKVYLPEALEEAAKEFNPCVLGIRARFDRPGHNTITVMPANTRYAVTNWSTKTRKTLLEELDEDPNLMIDTNTSHDFVHPSTFPPNDWIDDQIVRAKLLPHFVQLHGRVRELYLWVWGQGRDYTLSVEVEDWHGTVW